MSMQYSHHRRADGSYEVRRWWTSGMSWDVVATATNEARAKRIIQELTTSKKD